MNFVNPAFIFLMLPPLLIFAFFFLHRKDDYENFFAKEVLEKILIKGDKLGRKGRDMALILALIFFIFALSRPVSNESEIKIQQNVKSLVIAVDISRSMMVDDIYPTRLDFVKNRLKWLLNELHDTDIGIIAFAKDAFLVSPITNDKSSLEFLLNGLNSDMVSRQGTNITNALMQVENMFKNNTKDVLLISDGGEDQDIQKAINKAKEAKLKVSVMVVGSEKGGAIKTKDGLLKDKKGNIVISKRNERLRTLSENTNGVYIKEFGDGGGVVLLKNSLKSKKNQETTTIKTQKEWFMLPLIIALCLIIISLHGLPKKRTFMLFLTLFFAYPSYAGVLDFWHLKNIEEALEKKEYKKAINLYDKLSPSPQVNYNKANAYYKMKKYDEALKEYEKIQSDEKNFKSNVHFNKGNAYVKKNQYQKALKEYEEAKKLTPNDSDIDKNIEYVKKRMKKNKDKNKDKNDEKKDEKNQNSSKNKQNKNNKQNQKKENSLENNEKKDNLHEDQKKKQESNNEKKEQKTNNISKEDKEAKKWEKILLEQNPRTNPIKLESLYKGDDDEIAW